MLEPLDNLIHALSRLPGFGRRSSERAALALVRRPETLLDTLVQALQEAREGVCLCSKCGAFTTHNADPCPLCTRADRDDSLLCVVEDPADIHTIETAGAFRGRYHALMGKLSPVARPALANFVSRPWFSASRQNPSARSCLPSPPTWRAMLRLVTSPSACVPATFALRVWLSAYLAVQVSLTPIR